MNQQRSAERVPVYSRAKLVEELAPLGLGAAAAIILMGLVAVIILALSVLGG